MDHPDAETCQLHQLLCRVVATSSFLTEGAPHESKPCRAFLSRGAILSLFGRTDDFSGRCARRLVLTCGDAARVPQKAALLVLLSSSLLSRTTNLVGRDNMIELDSPRRKNPIGTRGSRAREWEGRTGRPLLSMRALKPELNVHVVELKTGGRSRQNLRHLLAIGGVGVFTKEIQRAVLDGSSLTRRSNKSERTADAGNSRIGPGSRCPARRCG